MRVTSILITEQKETARGDQQGQNGSKLMSGKIVGMRSPESQGEKRDISFVITGRFFLKERRKH